MAYFAVTYAYGAAEIQEQHRPAHRQYLGELCQQGKLAASGPYLGGQAPAALLIFVADSPEQVEEMIAQDPMQTGGAVLSYEINQWNPVIGKVGS